MKTLQVGGTRNDLMYQSVVLSIIETQNKASEDNKKIHLVVMSVWIYEIMKQYIKATCNIVVQNKSVEKGLTIMGYNITVIEDLDYYEPIQFIVGKEITT